MAEAPTLSAVVQWRLARVWEMPEVAICTDHPEHLCCSYSATIIRRAQRAEVGVVSQLMAVIASTHRDRARNRRDAQVARATVLAEVHVDGAWQRVMVLWREADDVSVARRGQECVRGVNVSVSEAESG